jgi:hypothetical protein
VNLISEAVPKPVTDRGDDGLDVMVYTLVPVLILAIIIAIVYWFYRQRKLAYFNEVSHYICPNEVYSYALQLLAFIFSHASFK